MQPIWGALTRRVMCNGIRIPGRNLYGLKPNSYLKVPPLVCRKYSTTRESSTSWLADFPPTRLELNSHPLGWEAIQNRVEPYFEENWAFTSEKEKNGFFACGFSRAFSEWYPLVLHDRVELTGKMHYLILLIDDQLDKMDIAEMLQYQQRVMHIARGKAVPNRECCLERMLYDTIESMKSIDESLTSDFIEGLCTLIQGQTTENRLTVKHLGPYLQYRETDVGRDFYTKLIRFGANLHLTPAELKQTAVLESHAFRFVGIFNDIYSWEKEWKAYQENKTDGAHLFSSILILAQETGLSYSACRRMMLTLCRELELAFKQAEEELHRNHHETLRPELLKYINSLEYFMSGIESWTRWTPRYRT